MTQTTTCQAGKHPKSTVRHTRAIARDRSKRSMSAPPAEAVVARLTEIVHPMTLTQVGYFHELGLRERILNLPIMVGLVLGMIWRQVGSGGELTRLIQQELVGSPTASRDATSPGETLADAARRVVPPRAGTGAAAAA